MGELKRIQKKLFIIFFSIAVLFNFKSPINAQTTTGQVIKIGSLDTLMWSIVTTIQWYTLPIMAIALAFLGVKLVMSGDDPHSKNELKGWIIKILVGGFIVFGATTIAGILKTNLS